MAHHKRKGPKSTRAGCLLCKLYFHLIVRGQQAHPGGSLRTGYDQETFEQNNNMYEVVHWPVCI